MEPIERSQWIDAGAATRGLISQLDMKQAAVARKIGMSESNLSKTLNGRRAATLDDCTAIEALLAAATDTAPEQHPVRDLWFVTADHPEHDTPAPTPDTLTNNQRRNRWALAAAVTLVGAAAVVLTSTGWRPVDATPFSNTPHGAAETMAHCEPRVGDLSKEVPTDMASWAQPMGVVYSNALSSYNWPCPTTRVRPHLRNRALVQHLADRDDRIAVIVGSSASKATILSAEQWYSVLAVSLLHDTATPTLTIDPGVPLRTEQRDQTSWVVMDHGTLVGATTTDPHFYLPTRFMDAWYRQGAAQHRLGMPMTHAYVDSYGRTHVEFEFGMMVAAPDEPVTVAVQHNNALPRTVSHNNALVITRDGTLWQLSDGTRRWVADQRTRSCLERINGTPIEVTGSALADIPLGPTAHC